MTTAVVIRTPPTIWRSHGEPLSFALPFVPRPSLGQTLGAFCILVPACLIAFFVAAKMFRGFVGIASTFDEVGTVAVFVFGLFLLGALFMAAATACLAGSWLAVYLSRKPVLEIHADGLIDRRVLKRKVGWDEFHELNRQHVLSTTIASMPLDASFRLKDGAVRRFSLQSLFSSIIFGGQRVYINTLGFSDGPAVISEIICAMILNARQDKVAPHVTGPFRVDRA